MHQDLYNLQIQQQILTARELILGSLSQRERERMGARVDSDIRAKMRHASPTGLAPVLVKRNHEPWFAAYLLQMVGNGGCRLLVEGEPWRIARTKKSALIFHVPEKLVAEHSALVRRQTQLKADFERLLETCRTTSKKGSPSQKSKRRIVKSS